MRFPVVLVVSLLVSVMLRTVGVAASRPHEAWTDVRLRQVVRRFASDNRRQRRRGEAEIRKSGLPPILPRLVRLQRRTPKNRELYLDLAYTLAYFGVDY